MSLDPQKHDAFLLEQFNRSRSSLSSTFHTPSPSVLPSSQTLAEFRSGSFGSTSDSESLSSAALGPELALEHIRQRIVPCMDGHNFSSRYYGFVTGSVLPVAEAADMLVSALDQNACVSVEKQGVASAVEDHAVGGVLDLLGLEREQWKGRAVTTGATASNILGLALAREFVVAKRGYSVAEMGLLDACAMAGVSFVGVLGSLGHSSVGKAASVIGLGRHSYVDVSEKGKPWRMSLKRVEEQLRKEKNGVLSIVVVGMGEVNTGRFALEGEEEMRRLRRLADEYGSWIHVDGAFGAFARALPETKEFATLRRKTGGLEYADSITLDCHKILNQPYDCGIFLTKHASLQHHVLQNPNASYLSAATSATPNPLDTHLENSRRFRGLPLYATLLSEGSQGIAAMQARMVRLARRLSVWINESEWFDLLPVEDRGEREREKNIEMVGDGKERESWVDDVHVIVLFKAKDDQLNEVLVERINNSREVFVTGTTWEGKRACRIAVSSWRVQVEEDAEFVTALLGKIGRAGV